MNDLTPLERALFAAIDREDFASACRNAFSGQSGVTLRKALCSVAHPFFPPVGKDALETYRQIGRSEIVTLLLRFSEAEATPAILIQSYPHGHETTPNPTAALASHFPGRCAHYARNDGGTDTTISDQCPGCPICQPGGRRAEHSDPAPGAVETES